MLKLVNPLYSPLAVLVGGVVLVVGVRFAQISSWVMVPLSGAIATVGASVLTAKQSSQPQPLNSALTQELTGLIQQAQSLARKAQNLKAEATQRLGDSAFVELLGTVQYACDRTAELPAKIERMAQRLTGDDSILAMGDLHQQRQEVLQKLEQSSGVARQQLARLNESLQRNIELARQGQDARQAQVANLSTLVLDSAGVLQSMQNQLRKLDLADTQQTAELQTLSDELREFQDNLDLLVVS